MKLTKRQRKEILETLNTVTDCSLIVKKMQEKHPDLLTLRYADRKLLVRDMVVRLGKDYLIPEIKELDKYITHKYRLKIKREKRYAIKRQQKKEAYIQELLSIYPKEKVEDILKRQDEQNFHPYDRY